VLQLASASELLASVALSQASLLPEPFTQVINLMMLAIL
jgi:hypothetical protein